MTRWLSLLLLAATVPALGQDPLQARLDFGTGYTRRTVDILGIRGDTVSFRVEGSTTTASTRLGDIRGIQFLFSNAVQAGLRAAAAGSWSDALRALHRPVQQLLPYASVPDTNAGEVLDAYAQALLELDRLEPLRALYQTLAEAGDPELARTSGAWLGYLEARAGAAPDLDRLFAGTDDLPRSHILHALREIAHGYRALATGDLREANDRFARVVASANLEMRLYPEALYLAGRSYDGLADLLDRQLEAQREQAIQRELFSERITVARKLQQDAERANRPPPSEEDILAAIDEDRVALRVPNVPPRTDNPHARNAQRLYQLITVLYPDSPWAARAGERIQTGFRLLSADRAMDTDSATDDTPPEDTTP